MPSFNKVIVVGNLTRDLELRYTPKGTPVGQAALAVNRNWTSESGEKKEEVTFIDFKVWGRSAETMAQYTGKGKPILIEGRLHQESWDDKQTGQKRSKLVVICEAFQFLGYRDDGDGGQRRTPAPTGRQEASENDGGGHGEHGHDDVPF